MHSQTEGNIRHIYVILETKEASYLIFHSFRSEDLITLLFASLIHL